MAFRLNDSDVLLMNTSTCLWQSSRLYALLGAKLKPEVLAMHRGTPKLFSRPSASYTGLNRGISTGGHSKLGSPSFLLLK